MDVEPVRVLLVKPVHVLLPRGTKRQNAKGCPGGFAKADWEEVGWIGAVEDSVHEEAFL